MKQALLVPYQFDASVWQKENQIGLGSSVSLEQVRDGIIATKAIHADSTSNPTLRSAAVCCYANLLVRFQMKVKMN